MALYKNILMPTDGSVHSKAAIAHGLELAEMGGGWMLAPKRELWEILKERYGRKNEQKLSRAALETLSIIAYSQPVTRAGGRGHSRGRGRYNDTTSA